MIIPDRLSELIKKGEMIPRYYNPCDLFDEVHILMSNDDRPDPSLVKKTIGRARMYLHNFPADTILFLKTLGWQFFLLRSWLKKGIKIIEEIKPDVIRVHNNFLEGMLAQYAKKTLDVPYVVSLHGVWDKDKIFTNTIYDFLFKIFIRKIEKEVLRDCNAVICVYEPIIRYAKKRGARKIYLIYNYVSDRIDKKQSYKLGNPPKIITINRQVPEKNPENIMRAVKDIDCQYLVVGDGVYHDYLNKLAAALKVENKVEFVRAINNERLLKMLPEFDLLVSHCDYWGISKTILEASLAGLPIIVNKHPVSPIPDYDGGWLIACDNSTEGYKSAISSLLQNHEKRETLGYAAYDHAKEHWDPAKMETKVRDIYKDLLNIS